MYEKNSRIDLDGLKKKQTNKHRDAKRTIYNYSFGKNTGILKKLVATYKENSSLVD